MPEKGAFFTIWENSHCVHELAFNNHFLGSTRKKENINEQTKTISIFKDLKIKRFSPPVA